MFNKNWFRVIGDLGKVIKQNANGQLQVEVANTLNATVAQTPKYPSPARVNPTITRVTNGKFPKYLDQKTGHMYGNQGAAIVKSTDYWETTTTLFTITNNYNQVQAVFVTESGRVVVCHQLANGQGEVYVSDVNQQNFAIAFTFTAGFTSYQMGFRVCGEVVLMTAYGTGGKEVYMSSDSGATWKKIFTYGTVTDASSNNHIHDAEYDPYAGRIIIATGDNGNANLYYSDDMGSTWTKVAATNASFFQYTQIISYAHGIVFCTDGKPDGFRYWKRPTGQTRAPILEADIVNLKLLDGSDVFKFFANKYSKVDSDTLKVTLVPWCRNGGNGEGGALLYASENGTDWYEIWRMETTSGNYEGFYNIIGPHATDPQRRIFGRLQKNNAGITELYLFQATLPKFI